MILNLIFNVFVLVGHDSIRIEAQLAKAAIKFNVCLLYCIFWSIVI